MTNIDRRSFLKLMGIAAPAILAPGAASWLHDNLKVVDGSKPNIIVLLFDAMSARNLSLYGYPRLTSPNLARFAERATVYHSHHAAGNYTIPGTASILTGTYPWTHRAVNHSGGVARRLIDNNIFNVLGNEYHRIAFPQNVWANFVTSQFENDLDTLLSPGTFDEFDYLFGNHFRNDSNMAMRSLDDFVFKQNQSPVSLVLGSMYSAFLLREGNLLDQQGYPRGLPQNVNYSLYFRLEKVMAGLQELLSNQPAPYFAYLHLFPPHAPYRPSRKFNRLFVEDGFYPVRKPIHKLSEQIEDDQLDVVRQIYDQYIASLDEELGHFLDAMESAGVFEDSYVVITSDHGEMFERGEKAHSTPLLYESITHIPLLISAPGQKMRRDIYSPTNSVDLLPTFAQWAGKPIPPWVEGKPLPGLSGDEEPERGIYAVEAKLSSAFAPLNTVTVSLQKGNNKLIYYTGYDAEDSFELYDLREDPEELEDLYPSQPVFSKHLKNELLETFFESNKP
ncbi:MAG: sulfatase-like hydrolase/transferase [Anaerolineales bacterium]|nr:sulfatase-like hydrolase/transferase [Anaerolineales bacterium]